MFLASLFQRKFNLFALLSAGSSLVMACSSPVSPDDYKAYLMDPAHGLTHVQEANGATVTCTYRPIPLLVLQDLTRISAPTAATRDSLEKTYAGKTYCAMSLTRDGGEIENALVTDPVAYQQALTYLNTGIAADTYLATTAHDSVPALASMYIRQYGTTGQSSILLVFDTHGLTPEKGFHLTFRAQRLGLGTLRFPFAARDLAALPALQLP